MNNWNMDGIWGLLHNMGDFIELCAVSQMIKTHFKFGYSVVCETISCPYLSIQQIFTIFLLLS